jgi:hypothetical protein
MLDKLNNHWGNATSEQIEHGLSWYKLANRECKRIAKKHRIVLWKVVGVMSALSPNNKWERNKYDCEQFIINQDHKACTFHGQRNKARAILKTNRKSKVEGILNGTKTRNFYHNIYNPLTSQRVTVDMWAMRSIDFTDSLTKKRYNEITKVHQDFARSKNLLPHQVQAVIWSVVREAS